MGEARRRGTFAERQRSAIKADKATFIERLGGVMDPQAKEHLQRALQAFLGRLTPQAWQDRRAAIVRELLGHPQQPALEHAPSLRVRSDEMGWYLFLCEQALGDPLCLEINQAQRALPYLASLGRRWRYVSRVKGIERKLDELLTKYRKQPDGVLFEVLTALAYAEAGWEVQFLEDGAGKGADLVVRGHGLEFIVECKRLDRRTQYAETEINHFLRLWDDAKGLLSANGQWIWFKGTFHVDVTELPTPFLSDIFRSALPLGAGQVLVHDSEAATIHARLIDRAAVQAHLRQYMVKANSPMESRLLGGDWAPEGAAVTIRQVVKTTRTAGCEVPVFGTYIDDVGFACGFTRTFDSEVSIEKKARDIISKLNSALDQLPADRPSIVHIAAETLEGPDVERRRTEKVMQSLRTFATAKPLAMVRFHRFQTRSSVDEFFLVDETVETWAPPGFPVRALPSHVVIGEGTHIQSGTHWDIHG